MQSLLHSIYGFTDPKMSARVAAVSNEALSMIDNFELAVAHLLTEYHVAAEVNNKRKNAQISVVGGYLNPGTSTETGVEIRYYKPHELFKLNAEGVDEQTRLSTNRKKLGDRGIKGGEKGNSKQFNGKKQPWKINFKDRSKLWSRNSARRNWRSRKSRPRF